MRNLLSANFLRLRKSGLFWGLLGVMFALGTAFTLQRFWEQVTYAEFGVLHYIDEAFFNYAMIIGILMAAFIPLFFGAEYNDGGFRNKLAVGHSRLSVYLAHTITAAAVAILFCLAYILAALAVGVPLLNGGLERPLPIFLLNLVGSLILAAAYSALFTLVTLNVRQKAVSAVACILGTLVIIFSSFYVRARLSEPETWFNYGTGETGEITMLEYPNDRYLRGAERAVYEFIYDFLPMTQSMQYYSSYSKERTPQTQRMIAYAALVSTLSTAAGAALFRKKDLK